MAIECRRCGGPTMPETIIKLRRGLLGFRETRSPGAYCVPCKLSVPMENPAATRPLIAIRGALVHSQMAGEKAPNPKLLSDDRLGTDGIRASGHQHPVQHRHLAGRCRETCSS